MNADDFINEELPASDRALFPKQFAAAYKAASDLIKSTPFLKCPPVQMAAGHITAWAVDFAISQLIESGQWKVEHYEWPHFKNRTGQYLRIQTKKSVLTINQLADTSEQPRKAVFRTNAAYDNQLFLMPPEVPSIAGKPHILLIHGYKDLRFIHAAMPNPEKAPAWLGMTRNLLDEIRVVGADLVPSEGPEEAATLTIKEALKKRIKDHGA
jgi:hypothetical protein